MLVLLIILYVSLEMIYRGSAELVAYASTHPFR